MRSHTCGELGSQHVGQMVELCGWAQNVRVLSDTLVFVKLRDAYGSVQLLTEHRRMPGFAEQKRQLELLSTDTLISVKGKVAMRPGDTAKGKSSTRDIEILVERVQILNQAKPLPFNPHVKANMPNEEVRLAHRYLDLRRPELQRNIRVRSKATMAIRQFMDDHGFVDIETPLLFKSTPEGAREFLVPTRASPGACYALPQSPQQFKQILMAAGFDRYYQIARCFRDEDLRADRQPEFTQVDMEMSFVTKEDIQQVMERLIQHVWSTVKNIQIDAPFRRMSFAEATRRFGSDKPDTRFGLEIVQIPQLSSETNIVAEALLITGGANIFSAKELTPFLELLRSNWGATGLTNITLLSRWLTNNGSSAGQEPTDRLKEILALLSAKSGDLLFVSERLSHITPANTTLGRLRTLAAKLLQEKGELIIPEDRFEFLWIEDFPLFTCEADSLQSQLSATHHPFTAPVSEDLPLLYSDPAKVRGQHYDLVLNGVELGGGSMRVHDPDVQQYIFEKVLHLSPRVRDSFSHLVAALGHGCPPHGGIALGLDRLIAVLTNSLSLRDVIAFPKSADGRDLFMHSPASASTARLENYGLQVCKNLPISTKEHK
ncbi:aspartyl-tRNA synthetase [Coemansia reversa NRRL 1564]|uniref:Aspartyl-tRNA synthetase n=1 Tax=Coemansia reversa (strain ATCC 12441 / NRRL 1564) TaxID=763665 RepID=A0A2G5B7G4_COERN|nr:aspartyl-tRNA synthetase [Coemansia reversa NRRL 1564]|eukprot:PIA14941.1 aspartyl-tRNA synthetase [Coemansia reversa NRRL 1564]